MSARGRTVARILGLVLAAILVFAAATAAGVYLTNAPGAPTALSTNEPESSVSTSVPPANWTKALPPTCAKAYPERLSTAFGAVSEFHLQSFFVVEDAGSTKLDVSDDVLQKVLDSTTQLRCGWTGIGPEDDPGDGDWTYDVSIALVSESQAQEVRERLITTGTCLNAERGVLCAVIHPDSEGVVRDGVTHFLRNGLWVVIDWDGFTPGAHIAALMKSLP